VALPINKAKKYNCDTERPLANRTMVPLLVYPGRIPDALFAAIADSFILSLFLSYRHMSDDDV